MQDMPVVKRARGDIGNQIIYPMRFVRNNQGRVVMDRAYNVVKMAEATAKAYNVIDNVEWDVDDPNVLKGSIGDGRSVFFRVNQRSEEIPATDRIETSEVAQIVFDGGDNGGYSLTPAAAADGIPDVSLSPPGAVGAAKQPKIKSSRRSQVKWARRRRRSVWWTGHRGESERVRLPHVVRSGIHREQGPARDAVHVQTRAVQGEQVQPRKLRTTRDNFVAKRARFLLAVHYLYRRDNVLLIPARERSEPGSSAKSTMPLGGSPPRSGAPDGLAQLRVLGHHEHLIENASGARRACRAARRSPTVAVE